MKTKWVLLSIIIVAVVLAAVGMMMHRNSIAAQKMAAQPKKQPLVAVVPVQRGSITRVIETSGSAEPENSVTIVPKVEQRITWMPFNEGDTVRKGQVIVRLDTTEAAGQLAASQAEVSVAEAKLRDVIAGSRPQELRAARAALAQAQLSASQAKRDLAHTKTLYGVNGIPEQQLDEAQSRYDTAFANAEAAKATWQDTEIELSRQKDMLKIGGVSQENVDKATTRYNVSRAALNSANAALKSANSNLAHVKELNVRVIPQQKLDEAESKYATALSSVESAKARLDLLNEGASNTQIDVVREQLRQANLKAITLKNQLAYSVITAPSSGVITRIYMNAGDLAQTKQPIMSLSVSGRMLVKAAITDQEAASIRVGAPAILLIGSKSPVKTKITRVYPSADTATRLVPIELALPAGSKAAQGAFVRVNLVIDKSDNCVLIPTDAILQKIGGKSIVFIVDGGKAAARPIVTGIESKGKVEIVSGLNGGEMLVIKGQEMLRDGVQVKVKAKKTPMGKSKPVVGASQ